MGAVKLADFSLLEHFCLIEIDFSTKRLGLFINACIASVQPLFNLLVNAPGKNRSKHILDMSKVLRANILIVPLPEDLEGIAQHMENILYQDG